MNYQNRLISAAEVAEALGVSRTYAYEVIKGLNNELRKAGYLTISGKVEGSYFLRRYFPSFEATHFSNQVQGGN